MNDSTVNMVSVSTAPAWQTVVPLPCCLLCGASFKHLTRYTTRVSNRNGNSGRPDIKCMPCNKFVTFLDDHGIEDRKLGRDARATDHAVGRCLVDMQRLNHMACITSAALVSANTTNRRRMIRAKTQLLMKISLTCLQL